MDGRPIVQQAATGVAVIETQRHVKLGPDYTALIFRFFISFFPFSRVVYQCYRIAFDRLSNSQNEKKKRSEKAKNLFRVARPFPCPDGGGGGGGGGTDLRVLVLLLGGVDGGVGADDGSRVLHHVPVLVHQQLALDARLDVLGGDHLHPAAGHPLV